MKIIELHSQPETIEVDLQVVFGSPSRTCAGSGVCKMLPKSFRNTEGLYCKMRPGKLSRLKNGDLRLSIPLEEFSVEDRKGWLSAKDFIVEEQFDIPAWLGRQLKCGLLSIPAGSYSFQVGDTMFITFPKIRLTNTLLQGQRNWRIANGGQ